MQVSLILDEKKQSWGFLSASSILKIPGLIAQGSSYSRLCKTCRLLGFLSGFLFGFRVLFLYQHVTVLVQKLKSGFVPARDRSGTKTETEIQKEILKEIQKTTRFLQSAVSLGSGFSLLDLLA